MVIARSACDEAISYKITSYLYDAIPLLGYFVLFLAEPCFKNAASV